MKRNKEEWRPYCGRNAQDHATGEGRLSSRISEPEGGAAALVSPEKKLWAIDAGFLLNRFGKKSFARGANRTVIASCQEELGIPLETFLALGLEAMQGISGDLGL